MVFGQTMNQNNNEQGNNEIYTLKGKVIISGVIELLTGLHIGGLRETLKIGGTDNPVIKDAFGNILIPGSSLKGKIRCLLEKKEGKYTNDNRGYLPCSCGDCNICKLFGPHNSKEIKEPRRVIFRDAYIEVEEGKEIHDYLEIKVENTIDRLKGTTITGGVRNTERVVAGSKFKFEIVFNVYKENDKELLKELITGMKLLEDDYLGGSGSRGYVKLNLRN
ncbi:Csm3 family CRISPR-associated RAMP protein [Methanocaldococcus villosus KIN24-T80]|uniref:CRISPR system Cms endoribonuclease Csm3 n=1 Tax=Methanocaldococcus villosus KIN24-T80 TaxID=1069083 RepID=N6UU88_9EURY|nr:Csm3 family CRISPR-associated RAMP protein [Methanocaldococcus villosus KIN24-T80]